jgi:glycosyltransferase involved in cell wall biosynthesis
MRIAFIAAGAAGMYCGSCLRDNALAAAMLSLGQEMTLIPAYTPLRVDEEAASTRRVFFGAVDVYLQQAFSSQRARQGVLGRLLGSRALLDFLSRFSFATSPQNLGPLTVSMLQGENGNQRRSLLELVSWLKGEIEPQVIHLTNSLFSGFARQMKRELGVATVCSLQGEDLFLSGLPEPYRARALELVRENAEHVDRFTATCAYHADQMSSWAGLERSKIDVVLPGIRLADYESSRAQEPGKRPLTIGYFARICHEKGLHLLADAFHRLCGAGSFPDLRLKAAGYLSGKDIRYARAIRKMLASKGLGDRVEILGTLDRAAKLEFFRGIDVLSVPAVHAEPKGLFVLEALASGVPVVEPRHGSFPELIEATGGGLLFEPGDPADLARQLEALLRDESLRRSLADRGKEAVHRRFSSERMARETLAIYEKLVASGGS